MNSKNELNIALRRLVKNHGVPLSKLASKLDVSPNDCLNWWTNKKSDLPVRKISNLILSIGADDDDLINDRIHSSTIETGILDFEDHINPKYSENAFSYVLSSRHIIEFITLKYGVAVANGILYKLGVHPGYFRNTANRISISFFEDLLAEYIKLGNPIKDISILAQCLFLTTESDPNGMRLFPKRSSYVDAMQTVYESTGSFDENFEYKFEITSNRVRIIARPSERLTDALRDSHYGSKELYFYRSIVFGYMSTLCGLPPFKMKTLECVSQGDDRSVYEGEFPDCRFLV